MEHKTISPEKLKLKEEKLARKQARKDAMNDTKFMKGWNNFKSKSFSKLQNLARVIVFPIAILPVAGLFLGIGGGLAAAAKNYGWGNGVYDFFNIMDQIGNIVFANLGLLFATSIGFGFAKQSKGVAAVASFVAFAAMEVTMSALFIPTTNTAGDAVVQFDPWHLAGQYGIVSVGTNRGMLKSVIGITPTLDLSVLGGILVGYLTSLVHNRTYNIRVPRVLAFFGGEKFVPIAAFLMGVGMGIVLFFVWPAILIALFDIGSGLGSAMSAGKEINTPNAGHMTAGIVITFFFGFIERMLIPAGLHHVFYSPFWYTSAGGQWLQPIINTSTNQIDGWTTISGSYNIFFAEMKTMGQQYAMTADAYQTLVNLDGGHYFNLYASQLGTLNGLHSISYSHFTMEVGTVFSSGRFSFMQYGYPFAAAAMIMLAKPENRARTSGILGSAAATSFLTGITEPMLFSFLFVAPLLWVFHACMAGISFALAYALNINVGQGFAAGFIDYSFFGLLPGYSTGSSIVSGDTNNYWSMWAGRDGAAWIPIYGLIIMAPSYFFGFWWIIKLKDYKTPGRESMENDQATLAVQASLLKGTKKQASQEEQIIKGLGEDKNILDFDLEGSKIVVTVKDAKKINEAFIATAGLKNTKIENSTVILSPSNAQQVYDKLEKAMKIKVSTSKSSNVGTSEGKINGYDFSYLETILEGLGGLDNIKVLDNCATRLRVNVKDPSKVDDAKLKSTRAIAVVKKGEGIQAIYGGEVQNIKVSLEEYIQKYKK